MFVFKKQINQWLNKVQPNLLNLFQNIVIHRSLCALLISLKKRKRAQGLIKCTKFQKIALLNEYQY